MPTIPLHAQEMVLPAPGVMLALTKDFQPAVLKGIKLDPHNPLAFNFLIEPSQASLSVSSKESEYTSLVKYFMTALTVPENEMWVNLSPYENQRIISPSFGATEMGRNMLAQDYVLKELTASLMYPENDLGKKFWQRIYTAARNKFGNTQIPVNTFNKVWILPASATIFEKGNVAIVTESRLRVMLEEDYVAIQHNSPPLEGGVRGGGRHETPPPNLPHQGGGSNVATSQIIREVIVPEIEKEVNQGANFTQLRQMYQSMVLAAWFKQRLKKHPLSAVYVNKNKNLGVHLQDINDNQRVYQHYLQAFKKGVYNYIKEETDPVTGQMIPRKYFSGGYNSAALAEPIGSDNAIISVSTVLNLPYKLFDVIKLALRINDAPAETFETQDMPAAPVVNVIPNGKWNATDIAAEAQFIQGLLDEQFAQKRSRIEELSGLPDAEVIKKRRPIQQSIATSIKMKLKYDTKGTRKTDSDAFAKKLSAQLRDLSNNAANDNPIKIAVLNNLADTVLNIAKSQRDIDSLLSQWHALENAETFIIEADSKLEELRGQLSDLEKLPASLEKNNQIASLEASMQEIEMQQIGDQQSFTARMDEFKEMLTNDLKETRTAIEVTNEMQGDVEELVFREGVVDRLLKIIDFNSIEELRAQERRRDNRVIALTKEVFDKAKEVFALDQAYYDMFEKMILLQGQLFRARKVNDPKRIQPLEEAYNGYSKVQQTEAYQASPELKELVRNRNTAIRLWDLGNEELVKGIQMVEDLQSFLAKKNVASEPVVSNIIVVPQEAFIRPSKTMQFKVWMGQWGREMAKVALLAGVFFTLKGDPVRQPQGVPVIVPQVVPVTPKTEPPLMVQVDPVGGIDFDSQYLQMNIQGDSAEMTVPQGFEWLLTQPIKGFIPQIQTMSSGVPSALSFFQGIQ